MLVRIGAHNLKWIYFRAADGDTQENSGRPVARGIYFVRVVGPGFDEMRKVLVVR